MLDKTTAKMLGKLLLFGGGGGRIVGT